MRPDLEWRIGEEADEETLISPRQPLARWRAGAVLLVVAAGLGLGLLYSSIPEPPPRPAMLPASKQNPISDEMRHASHTIDDTYIRFNLLRETIDQEVAALADGDEAAFLAVQDQTDLDWLKTQRRDFSTWGRPTSPEERPGMLYFYSENTLSADDREVWIDIRQYRQGSAFRETRFYRWQDNHWVRVRPLLDFWSGASYEITTPHFRVKLPWADQPLADDLVQRLENTYQRICFDLACSDDVLTLTEPLRVLVSPELMRQQAWFEPGAPITLHLPSPRVSGLLGSPASAYWDDPLTQLLTLRLSEILARAISGGNARWDSDSNGVYFMNAVALWELQRHQGGIDLDAYLGVELLKGRKLTLPKYLWDWPVRDSRRLASPQAQANSVIAFIDRSFGAERAVYFLRTLRTAQSLPQAIEAALPISYAAFEQQWQTWLNARLND